MLSSSCSQEDKYAPSEGDLTHLSVSIWDKWVKEPSRVNAMYFNVWFLNVQSEAKLMTESQN